MADRDFKGIWIPKEIWLETNLSIQEKLFIVEIDSLDNEKGCFAGNKYFADFFEISKTRVSQVIKSLIEKNYITSTIFYKEGTKEILKRVLQLSYIPPLEKFNTLPKEVVIPPLEKFRENNTILNNTINNTISTEDKPPKSKRFIIPTIEEVKLYCQERKNNVDAERFINYYSSNGWKVGKNAMKDWKAAIRTWEQNNQSSNAKPQPNKVTTGNPFLDLIESGVLNE